MTDKNPSRGKPTGAGAEASEGIRAADEADGQADGDTPAEEKARRGSEPTTSHSTEHKSSYGGGGVHGGNQS